jgi:hypothetical protein
VASLWGGIYPDLAVLIDGAKVGAVTVNSGTFANFTIPNVPLQAGTHTLVASFTNDAFSDTEDRNVIVDRFDFLTASDNSRSGQRRNVADSHMGCKH